MNRNNKYQICVNLRNLISVHLLKKKHTQFSPLIKVDPLLQVQIYSSLCTRNSSFDEFLSITDIDHLLAPAICRNLQKKHVLAKASK